MYVALRNKPDPWHRVVADFLMESGLSGVQKVHRARRARGMRGLGDTCFVTPQGQRVCASGDPAAQVVQPVCLATTTPQNVPSSANVPGAKSSTITVSGNSFTSIVRFGNTYTRTYTFKYHAGTIDVYLQTSGPTCSGCNYATVDGAGNVIFIATPPGQAEPPCSLTDPANPNPAAPTPGGATTCYSGPGGNLVCGSGTLVYPAASATTNTYPAAYADTGFSTAPSGYTSTQAAAPASTNFFDTLPSWAKYAGAAAGGVLLLKYAKGK